MDFEFATSQRIIFGAGNLNQVGKIASVFGNRAFILAGSGSVPLDGLWRSLSAMSVSGEVFRVEGEPDVLLVNAGLELAKQRKCELVIGFGGGAVLDTAKVISAMLNNPGELIDYLEVIGAGKKITNQPLPMIAIPTTAGTGTEVTRNAVIKSNEHQVKVSMRSPMMIPRSAIIDPELTYSMPPSVTASTGMDALTQVIEPYVSNRANPMTDIIAQDGIKRGARSLLRVYEDGKDQCARKDLALTSLFGGLALANAGLGAVHGFAGVLGGMYDAPHGEICANLLPFVMKYNVQVLSAQESSAGVTSRYQNIARWVTGDPQATIEAGVAWIADLAESLGIPGLHSVGIEKEDFDQIIEKSKVSSSMKNNPVKLDDDILRAILQEAY